jgi:hypothetical protein
MNDDRLGRAARDAIGRTTAASEQAAQGVQEGFTSAVENVRDLNVRLINMARANTEAGFDFAHEVATARAPSDLMQAWSTHIRKQFEMLTKQASELAVLAQNFASTTTETTWRNLHTSKKD